MYKNAEGYRDETACRAIIAVAREERIKRRKLAASIGIEPQITEKEVVREVPVEIPSNIAPADPQKCCDAEVQELMIRAERAEALLEEYRELYRKVIEKI